MDGGCHPGHPWERLPLTVAFHGEDMDYWQYFGKGLERGMMR